MQQEVSPLIIGKKQGGSEQISYKLREIRECGRFRSSVSMETCSVLLAVLVLPLVSAENNKDLTGISRDVFEIYGCTPREG